MDDSSRTPDDGRQPGWAAPPPRNDDLNPDWLISPTPPADAMDDAPGRQGAVRRLAPAAGLLLAGALAGGIAVTALTHDRSATDAASVSSSGTNGGTGTDQQQGRPGLGNGDGDRGGFGGGFGGGFRGGIAGEQRLRGTVAAVGSSSVTVKTASGSATYRVNGTTEIVRDGARAQLSDLKVGDPVLVHVYPSSSGGAMLVERIIAGTLPSFDGPPAGPPGTDDGAGGGVNRT